MDNKEAKEVSFQEVDNSIRYKYKDSRLMSASRDGYDYISEHIVMTYRKTKSLRETGKICGDISTVAVRSILKKCGETLRKPGGRVWTKLTDDDVRYIRGHECMNNRIFIKVAKELSKSATERFGKETKVSSETIRNIWKHKTHKNVI